MAKIANDGLTQPQSDPAGNGRKDQGVEDPGERALANDEKAAGGYAGEIQDDGANGQEPYPNVDLITNSDTSKPVQESRVPPQEDVLAFISRMMGIDRARASELTGLANDAVAEVLDPEHIIDLSPELDEVLENEEQQVDLAGIAERLHLQVSEFHSWTEDEMIFIEYGVNLSEGLAAEGPTALSATANFYCRWYNDVILKHGAVLLSDEQHHRYNEQGEQ